jgi:hypothetical protein
MKDKEYENLRRDEELQKSRILNAKKTISSSLCSLERSVDEIKWACQASNWNDDVIYLIEDANLKLGYALATLEMWFEFEDEEPKEKEND